MYADKLLSLINKFAENLEFDRHFNNSKFRIPEKCVIVFPDYIGDVLLLTPLIRNLRLSIGYRSKIDGVCNGVTYNLLETNPYLNNLFIRDEKSFDRKSFFLSQNYDTAFLFNFSLKWSLDAFKTNISQRVSFDLQRLGFRNLTIFQNLITHFVNYTPINDTLAQRLVYLNALKDLELPIRDDHPEITLTQEDLDSAKRIYEKNLNNNKLNILIQASAGSIGKSLKADKWVQVVKFLSQKYDCNIIATGTTSDSSIYNEISQDSGVKIIDLCGQTSIRETVSLCRNMDLAITLDTAMAHIAGLAGIQNIIVIYGPTNHEQWKPYAPYSNIKQVYIDLPCRPCITRICSHKNCLNLLSAEMIINAIEQLEL